MTTGIQSTPNASALSVKSGKLYHTQTGRGEVSDTVKLLLEKYGATLDMDQLAEVMHIGRDTIDNRRMAGKLGIPTFKLAGPRLAYVEDVAKYLEAQRAKGVQEFRSDEAKLAS